MSDLGIIILWIKVRVCIDRRLSHPLTQWPLGKITIVSEVLICLIVKHIHREEVLCSELEKCFYLLWSSIPDPTVTKQQLADEIKYIFQRSPENQETAELKEEMEMIINSYDNMPFLTERAPRSLSHLCRCFIRRTLAVSGNLPLGVNELDIPKTLRSYLLLTNPQDLL